MICDFKYATGMNDILSYIATRYDLPKTWRNAMGNLDSSNTWNNLHFRNAQNAGIIDRLVNQQQMIASTTSAYSANPIWFVNFWYLNFALS